MLQLNGYWYYIDEVKEALTKRGCEFCMFEYEDIEEVGNHHMEVKVTCSVYCAIKPGEEPSRDKVLYTVAQKEFEKPVVKPPLV